MNMSEWNQTLRVRPDIVTRRIAGEALLIPIRGRLADMQRVFALDPVAEHIWNHLDGHTSLEGVLQSLVRTFAVAEDQARADLLEFVSELQAAGLVEASETASSAAGANSRG
jgi:hypothetical protein